jgi:CDP-glucose 4,6-dehydratase
MNAAFWKGRRVLVTGHTGFKGGWLCLWLQRMGAEVVGYALEAPTSPNLFQVARVEQGMVSVIGDIRNLDSLSGVFAEHKPEVVFHLAAMPLVRQSYKEPVETYATNVMGSVHVLEAARRTKGIRAVVMVTSDKCYDNKEWVWGYRENEPMGGYDPYSNSKGCAELVTSAYRNSFFNPEHYEEHGVAVASARAGNVIGGGDWAADRLIPDMIRAICDGAAVRIRSPHAIRPWQHVLEPLSGYLALAEKLVIDGAAYASGWNFGPRPEDAKPVDWIANCLAAEWGGAARWFLDENPQPHEAQYLKLDISKAEAILGWTPKWRLEQAIKQIVLWHKDEIAGADMRALTLSQIDQYLNCTA